MKKLYLDYKQVEGFVNDIAREILTSSWRPDYIVGITRGGLLPATLLSHYLNVPMHSLDISLRDSSTEPTSNMWMAEDAYGYLDEEDRETETETTLPELRKKILVVDDINDTGATIKWLKEDWQSGCLPNDSTWQEIWGDTVRFAFIVNNESSEFKDPNYSGLEINKAEKDVWVVFPTEEWWKAKP